MKDMRKPVVTPCRALDLGEGRRIWIKDETAQVSGAFKFRGSFSVLNSPEMQGYQGELVTASTGNHAAGLSWSAKSFGLHAVIFVPKTTPDTKVRNIFDAGGEVRFHGNSYEEALKAAKQYAKAEGAALIPSFDHPKVIEGLRHVYDEAIEQMGQIPDRIYVPVGGGGILAGILSASTNTTTRVIGVEFEDYTRIEKILNGTVDAVPQPGTPPPPSVEGIAVCTLGHYPLQVMKVAQHLDIRQVSYSEMKTALKLLWEKLGIRAELGACSGLAAALQQSEQTKTHSLCIVTGGNIALDLHQKLVEK